MLYVIEKTTTPAIIKDAFLNGILTTKKQDNILYQRLFDKKTLQDIKDCNDPTKGKECFDRLVAMNALVRPGSNLFIDDFADRILHPEHITYLVPELEPILKDTYGIILYQEQTMRITRDLAGFSAGQADTVRKALG